MYAFALKKVEKKIDDNINIKIHIQKNLGYSDTVLISALQTNNNNNNNNNNKNNKVIASISLSTSNTKLAQYSTDKLENKWFSKRFFMQKRVIKVLNLHSELKGYGSIMLAYGVLYMKCRYPDIDYSTLDDVSNQATSFKNNIYSKFGYTPLFKATQKNNNVLVEDGTKQVYLPDFLEKTNHQLDLNLPFYKYSGKSMRKTIHKHKLKLNASASRK